MRAAATDNGCVSAARRQRPVLEQTEQMKTALVFQKKIEQSGGRCELKLFTDARHPLYGYRKGGSLLRDETLHAADDFLADLGFMPDRPVKAAY